MSKLIAFRLSNDTTYDGYNNVVGGPLNTIHGYLSQLNLAGVPDVEPGTVIKEYRGKSIWYFTSAGRTYVDIKACLSSGCKPAPGAIPVVPTGESGVKMYLVVANIGTVFLEMRDQYIAEKRKTGFHDTKLTKIADGIYQDKCFVLATKDRWNGNLTLNPTVSLVFAVDIKVEGDIISIYE